MLLARGEPDDVAGPDLFDRTTLALRKAGAESDDQDLAKGMGVPGRTGAGLEGDGRAADPRGGTRGKPRVDADDTGGVFGRPLSDGREPLRLMSSS